MLLVSLSPSVQSNARLVIYTRTGVYSRIRIFVVVYPTAVIHLFHSHVADVIAYLVGIRP